MTTKYYGKYRGTVVNNIDPMFQGRVQVMCPKVLGLNALAWAMPCVPFAGLQVGFHFKPPIGGNIWVEFEGGDPTYPIWSGCFWGKGELPLTLPTEQIIKTLGVKLSMDSALGITIELATPPYPIPAKVRVDATGVAINYPPCQIQVTPAMVRINGTALEILPSGQPVI